MELINFCEPERKEYELGDIYFSSVTGVFYLIIGSSIHRNEVAFLNLDDFSSYDWDTIGLNELTFVCNKDEYYLRKI